WSGRCWVACGTWQAALREVKLFHFGARSACAAARPSAIAATFCRGVGIEHQHLPRPPYPPPVPRRGQARAGTRIREKRVPREEESRALTGARPARGPRDDSHSQDHATKLAKLHGATLTTPPIAGGVSASNLAAGARLAMWLKAAAGDPPRTTTGSPSRPG